MSQKIKFDFAIGITYEKDVSIRASSYADAIVELKNRIDTDKELMKIKPEVDYVMIHYNNNLVDSH